MKDWCSHILHTDGRSARQGIIFSVVNRVVPENVLLPSATQFSLISCAFVEMRETQTYVPFVLF